ncbi:hypothetical protein CLOM_g19017 [Closterium sp. NIES-68]|nr:hypothetical protein CLOM_g19017 [Closterium sp. NIES-68]GJP65901.1 hypothetical protein CLOP_g22802 [Closterium sp. NIES-67]
MGSVFHYFAALTILSLYIVSPAASVNPSTSAPAPYTTGGTPGSRLRGGGGGSGPTPESRNSSIKAGSSTVKSPGDKPTGVKPTGVKPTGVKPSSGNLNGSKPTGSKPTGNSNSTSVPAPKGSPTKTAAKSVVKPATNAAAKPADKPATKAADKPAAKAVPKPAGSAAPSAKKPATVQSGASGLPRQRLVGARTSAGAGGSSASWLAQNGGATCDISVGTWIPSSARPAYASTCPYISSKFNCVANGRPDGGYQHLLWQPRDCNMTLFSPLLFSLMFQDKTLALVGDSNAEYLFQSLRCQLATGLQTETVNVTAGTEAFRVIGSNTLVLLVDAPFLSYASPAVQTLQYKASTWNVHLDVLHPTLRQILPQAHAVIFSSGSWFLSPNRVYYRNGRPLAAQITGLQAHSTVLGALSDYLTALKSGGGSALETTRAAGAGGGAKEAAAAAGVAGGAGGAGAAGAGKATSGGVVTRKQLLAADGDTNSSSSSSIQSGGSVPRTFFLSIPPAHTPNTFRYQDTSCGVFAEPLSEPDQAFAVGRSAEAAWTASERTALSGSDIQLLDILGMAMYRPDGHVARYGSKGGMGAMDCGGWCLPGVPDAWVDMFFHLYASPTGVQQVLLGLARAVGAAAVGDVCWQVPRSAETIAGYV